MISTTSTPMEQVNIEDLEFNVKKMYSDVADHPEMAYHFEIGKRLAEKLGYKKEELDKIPYEAIESFAGVGHVFEVADLKPGDVVVDLGSGSGMDAFYAANQVGGNGEVYGIEMTEAQLAKAEKLKRKGAFSQTYFIAGHIESLPIIANTIDAVISNGVINLSSKKKNVFKECARVLKHGGKLVISDIISTKKLPDSITGDARLWAACIGGATEINEYSDYITHAGFKILSIKENPYEFISSSAKDATKKYGISSVTILAVKQ